MTPYMWRNFVNGVPAAREGQMEPFFFAKKAFQIQIVSEKAKNRTKNGQKTAKKRCFYWHFCPHSAKGAHHLRNSANGANKNTSFLWYFARFCPFFAFSQFVFEMFFLQKKMAPFDLL